MDKIKEQFINVTLVTFESKSNMAFVYWRWGKYGANFFERLSKRGLLYLEMAQIRNNESGLMGVTNFRYQSFDAVEKSAPI